MSLYQRLREKYPSDFRVDPHSSLDRDNNIKNEDILYVDENNPCKDCVVAHNRSPEDCDPCDVNPNRERFKKSGLL